jgi:tyrosyl-tRNA synthetase
LRALARKVVARFHGDEAARAAEAEFDRVFVEHAAPEEMDEHVVAVSGDEPVHVPGVVADAVGVSRSEARRLLKQGAVKLDGERVAEQDVAAERLDGAVLQVGKRQFRRLRVASA